MTPAPCTMLLRCATRCNRNAFHPNIHSYRTASSVPFVGSDVVIPPESPRYAYIPTSPQTRVITKKPNKGLLPRPRNTRKVKESEVKWHIENTMPEPVIARTTEVKKQHKDRLEWKTEETRLRRVNFQTGFSELRRRRKLPGKPMSGKTRQRVAIRHERYVGPEPFYEQMSRPSILSMMKNTSVWKHPRRSKEDIEARKAEYAKVMELKDDDRRTALHTLYINAKDFIVNNEQLEKRLDKVFESEFYRYNKNKDYGVWDEQGWPEDTSYLMDKAQTTGGVSAISQDTGYTEIARKRIMKVTEEMTGGKLVLEDKEMLFR